MRASTVFNRLLRLPGIRVTGVVWSAGTVTLAVALRRRRLTCPADGCRFSTAARYDTRDVDSTWLHLDLGSWRCLLTARLRRLDCRQHGVRVEAVPFARAGSRFTRDFEQVVAWLATKTDKTAITRFLRIDWDTVGRICGRMVADTLDADRLDGLIHIGVDEVSWRRHHRYLTLVTDHARGKVVWGAEGKDTATLDAFFTELGAHRASRIAAVSMDMGAAYPKSVRADRHAPQAVICVDPFHVVKLAGDALDQVRRAHWQELRKLPDRQAARRFKGARWALLKNPANLSAEQAATLRRLKRAGGQLWRGYTLKEALRAVFTDKLGTVDVDVLLDRWCSRASRSRLAPFVKAAATIRKHRDGILAAIRHRVNNARPEALNNKVRLIVRRAYGFRSATAALALVMLTCGPVTLVLPHERSTT